ncbi:hypothetical protein MMC25_007969 [Agyrium rufum]|nr:hypothetical protein [Agyrium rufum]
MPSKGDHVQPKLRELLGPGSSQADQNMIKWECIHFRQYTEDPRNEVTTARIPLLDDSSSANIDPEWIRYLEDFFTHLKPAVTGQKRIQHGVRCTEKDHASVRRLLIEKGHWQADGEVPCSKQSLTRLLIPIFRTQHNNHHRYQRNKHPKNQSHKKDRRGQSANPAAASEQSRPTPAAELRQVDGISSPQASMEFVLVGSRDNVVNYLGQEDLDSETPSNIDHPEKSAVRADTDHVNDMLARTNAPRLISKGPTSENRSRSANKGIERCIKASKYAISAQPSLRASSTARE